MTKSQLQLFVLVLGTLAIFCANLPDALPPFYKGMYHAVGSDVVRVSPQHSDGSIPTVAVTDNPSEKSTDTTSERVTVLLRNNYREDEIHRSPRRTLLILLGLFIFYGIGSLVNARKPTHPPSAD